MVGPLGVDDDRRRLWDDMTDTPAIKQGVQSSGHREHLQHPLSEGMAGCAMIGQSVINVKSGYVGDFNPHGGRGAAFA